MDVLEVSENGTLTVPAEALGGAGPKARFRVEERDGGLLLREEAPSDSLSPEEWWERFQQYSEAVSEAWNSDKSAAEIISEMRR
jgi:hypothetical protein